ncbi:hypothetical protein NQ318_010482 [Aromia moschata]|uniref:Uncharacterized protein n=1 Tax=Aromia moschata TaxID=1265417 RepID=A0AAV8YAN2_9CUCU|nr:hypothetical protein NQ318_010482 [Aromia moschata]
MNSLFRRFPHIFYRNTLRVYSSDVPDFDMENPFEKDREQLQKCKALVTISVSIYRQNLRQTYNGFVFKQQELVEKEIVKSQNAGLMATYLKEPCYLKDPQLFDVDKPIRPHRF